MKKKIYIILLIIILVIILLICYFIYYTPPKIISGPATLSKETVLKFNSRFEKYIGVNDSESIKNLLLYCIENYLYFFDESAKVPQVKYITPETEKVIKFDFDDYNNASCYYKENTNYYINLNELIQNLSNSYIYDVKVSYDTNHNFDNTFLVNEIEITLLH